MFFTLKYILRQGGHYSSICLPLLEDTFLPEQDRNDPF